MIARNGWARGSKPGSPGNLTARVFNENQQRAEAAKRAAEDGDPYKSGFTAGWSRGFDQGWDAGADSVLAKFREAGLDVDAILALDDAPGKDGE
jgi:hypothetical protein